MTFSGHITRFVVAIAATSLAAVSQVIAATKPPPDTPQAFADQLVALYSGESRTVEDGRTWDRWHDSLYDPELLKLIGENHEQSSRLGDLDLDHDPICGCQSGSGYARIYSVRLRPDGLAEVSSAHCYRNPPNAQLPDSCNDVDLIIKRIDGAWKLYDVMERGSLRDELIRENACMRSAKGDSDRQC
jgi:hypothetical protein